MYLSKTMAVVASAAIWGSQAAAAQAPSYYATNNDSALTALIAYTLEQSPRLQRAFLEYQAVSERILQAGSLPDPALTVTQHLRGPETRVGPQMSNVSLSQTVPWFGIRSDRTKIAETAAARQFESYAEQRAEAIHQIKLTYYDLAYVDQALRIAREEEQLLLHYETLAQARYSQGFGQQQEVLHLQAEVTRILNRQQELARQRLDLEAALNYLAARPASTPVPPVAIGERPALRLDGERLRAIGLETRAEVRSARLQIESEERAIRLARRRYRPAFTLGVAWGNVLGRRDSMGRANPPPDNGRDVYSVTVGVNIPLFTSSYAAGVREAATHLAAAEAMYLDAVDAVAMAVRSAAFRLTTINDQVDLFEETLRPQAEQALRTTEEAYSAGVIGVLELLDSEEMLLEVRLGQARLLADFMKALADMERAIGSAFPEEGS